MNRGTVFALLVFNGISPGNTSQGFFISRVIIQGGAYDEL